MVELTLFETDVINGIAYHEMNPANGCTPECASDVHTYCWTEDFSDKLTVPQIKGVLSSLVKKNLIGIAFHDGEDNAVWFTEAGFIAWQAVDRQKVHVVDNRRAMDPGAGERADRMGGGQSVEDKAMRAEALSDRARLNKPWPVKE